MTEEIKKIITEAKSICLIPSKKEPESVSAALALFYTLKDLGKNVNVLIDTIPENLQFLIPSLDFISQPQNFVIAVPRSIADVSQIYYEKNEQHLKIHLTLQKGQLKKDHIDFYAEQAKPDLIITLGIANFQQELAGRLDAFAFLLDTPILNIDTNDANTKFGKISIIQPTSLTEITLSLITMLGEQHLTRHNANCLLAGLLMRYENFKSPRTSPETFERAGYLIKRGAEHHVIAEHINALNNRQIQFLGSILSGIRQDNSMAEITFDSRDFFDFSEQEAATVVEKVGALGITQDLLVLWQSHASEPVVKGFFYSKKAASINKFAEHPHAVIKQGWVSLAIPGQNMDDVKNNLLTII